jgi:Ni2+-binding GTPase involved in maturation of urease and hydrogenase
MIRTAIDSWDMDELDFLLIENVGNLVCPSSYDIGEDLRVILLSVTEGEDKPLKYPTIFKTADVAILTKMDLAGAVEFNISVATEKHRTRPARHAAAESVLEDWSRHGGMDTVTRKRAQTAVHGNRPRVLREVARFLRANYSRWPECPVRQMLIATLCPTLARRAGVGIV